MDDAFDFQLIKISNRQRTDGKKESLADILWLIYCNKNDIHWTVASCRCRQQKDTVLINDASHLNAVEHSPVLLAVFHTNRLSNTQFLFPQQSCNLSTIPSLTFNYNSNTATLSSVSFSPDAMSIACAINTLTCAVVGHCCTLLKCSI